MEFRVLGPIEMVEDGRAGAVGGPKPKTLLALLAVRAGRTVSFDEVVDAIWGANPPGQARSAVHTYVSFLRRSMAALQCRDLLRRSGGGYVLATEPEHVDVLRFHQATACAGTAFAQGRPQEAAARFTEALELWRGTALGGAQGWWAENERARLADLHCTAVEDRADACLATGRGADVLADLRAAIADHPFRERLHSHLIAALLQAGRRADAYAEYSHTCTLLRDELGLEPGPVLRAVYNQLAVDEREPSPVAAFPADRGTAPRQIPRPLSDFTGRVAETTLLASAVARPGEHAPVCTIFGMPGAGKSALATQVGHQVRGSFSDGQLYASLGGVTATPADPGDVLAAFLRDLGVPLSAIPVAVPERAQLYRTVLADRRLLVVLDDAADEHQVRPLLPGDGRCAVLITSRQRLSALDGAEHLHLPLLNDADAVLLLERIIGVHRVRAEPKPAAEIARLCGQLPLALRVAGNRLAAHPHWPLSRLATRLGVRSGILEELVIGDVTVRGSVALSYHRLGEREQAALRRLALLDVANFGAWLLGPLLDIGTDEAEDLADRLADAQLLDVAAEADDGFTRFRVHNLVSAVARERGEVDEPPEEVGAALTRIAESLLVLVEASGSAAPPDHRRPRPQVVAARLADADRWFSGERTGLVRVVERVSERGLTGAATRLATALCRSRFSPDNLFGPWWRAHSAALAAADDAGDHGNVARLLADLGWLRYEQDRFDESVSYYERAITAYSSVDDRTGQAKARLALSTVLREQGLLGRAREVLDLATPRLTEPGDLARAAHELARVATELGDFAAALSACERATGCYREIGDKTGEALTLRTAGIIHRAAGRLPSAAEFSARAVSQLEAAGQWLPLAYARQSLAKVRIRQHLGNTVRDDLVACHDVCREMRDGFGQALVLRTLGELELASGKPAEARNLLDHALEWWQALALPLWRARTLRDLSSVHASAGRFELADETWYEAQQIFLSHGTRESREPRVAAGPAAVSTA